MAEITEQDSSAPSALFPSFLVPRRDRNAKVTFHIKQLNLELGSKIIAVMCRFGFPMQETDLIRYHPEGATPTALLC
jgi:hypothetical protein